MIEDIVRRVACVQNDAQPVGLRYELFPQRRQAVPFRALRIGRGIAQIVVGEMHRTGHPHAQLVERFEQRQVLS